MPKVDKTVEKVFLEPINEARYKRAYLFVNEQKKPYWWLRLDLPGSKQVVRSTKIRYFENSPDHDAEAKKVAWQIYAEIDERIDQDLAPKVTTINSAVREYMSDAEEGYKLNEQLGAPAEKSIFGAYWTRQNYTAYKNWYDKIILPFFKGTEYLSKPITEITQRDITKWMAWRTKKFPTYSPSALAKIDTALRAVFEYALEVKGERFVPPRIKSPKQDLVARRRPMIDDEKFYKLQKHLREQFQKELAWPLQNVPLKAEQRFLFYCWIETLEHTGIRPWTSKERAIKMSDIEKRKSNSGEVQIFVKRNEKGKNYSAPATRYWIHTLNRLDAFYEARGLKEREWLLCHSRDNVAMGIKRGDPIASFKTAWNTAIKHLGFNDSELPKNKRFTPYTIRHRVITKMLLENPELSPIEIAANVGSSLEMVSKIYYEHRAARNYEKLQENKIDYLSVVDTFSESGGWQGAIGRNSEEHIALYRENPKLVGGVKPK
ncbi:hypothetical protein N9Q14_03410 [Pseudomonadales bacterium]|nr:hypothetical protein [Pseudomonadales bacterium]